MPTQIVLMDRDRIDRTVKRMAIQVWEQIHDGQQLVVIGLNERGFATANHLISYLKELLDEEILVHRFDVHNSGSNTSVPDCTEKFVLLVDDVIFSGKTMFSALSTICYSNEPEKIEILTLVDRGHRTYPLLCGLTGIEVPTKFGEHIEVILSEGNLDQVVLFKNQ